MNQIELEKIADHFDRDHDGYIDLGEINSILRGIRRARSLAKRHPLSDSEKIDHEVIEYKTYILYTMYVEFSSLAVTVLFVNYHTCA